MSVESAQSSKAILRGAQEPATLHVYYPYGAHEACLRLVDAKRNELGYVVRMHPCESSEDAVKAAVMGTGGESYLYEGGELRQIA